MKEQYVAHVVDGREQSVKEHLENVACLAAYFCGKYQIPEIDVEKYAYTTGLAHDLGKYSNKFQKKIKDNINLSVDHSTAGARELWKRKMLAAAFAIAGHHGGLPNGKDLTDTNFLVRVQNRKLEDYEHYQSELKLEAAKEPFSNNQLFEEAFFTRMLFSALVDADFLDTEKFMQRGQVCRTGYADMKTLRQRLMQHVKPWRENVAGNNDLNAIRTQILENCIQSGKRDQGLYSLTVPTGGGKTISSLAFALEHAVAHDIKRIIYVVPYTSIIEQNAEVFGKVLGKENVVEHHSNLLFEEGEKKEEYHHLHHLSTENWDAPIIVTTNVQFFESLYSCKVSTCRKLHNIAGSVVVFDEAQMIPLKYLKPCVMAIKSLVENYHVTALLCTATQPALEKWFLPVRVHEICENYSELFERLKRVMIKNAGILTEEMLAEHMKKQLQILAVVNKKSTAQKLFQMLPAEGTYHLSTYMTPEHRKKVIVTIRERLTAGLLCRVVSTSLIEAGVDMDFPCVYREKAGLDSIIQAGGRCNREGRRSIEESMVWVFELMGSTLPMLEKNIAILDETMEKYKCFDDPKAIHYYFETLQNLDEGYLDAKNIIVGTEQGIDGILFPFREIDKRFRLIEQNTRTVYIPRDEKSQGLIEELENRIKSEENFTEVIRKLSTYAVNIYEYEYKKLEELGALNELIDGITVLINKDMYSEQIGLCIDEGGEYFIM